MKRTVSRHSYICKQDQSCLNATFISHTRITQNISLTLLDMASVTTYSIAMYTYLVEVTLCDEVTLCGEFTFWGIFTFCVFRADYAIYCGKAHSVLQDCGVCAVNRNCAFWVDFTVCGFFTCCGIFTWFPWLGQTQGIRSIRFFKHDPSFLFLVCDTFALCTVSINSQLMMATLMLYTLSFMSALFVWTTTDTIDFLWGSSHALTVDTTVYSCVQPRTQEENHEFTWWYKF